MTYTSQPLHHQAQRPTSIEVLELRRLSGEGCLRGFAKVRIGAIIVHGVRIIQQPGQKAWCALPQTPARKKADGSGAGWFPVIEISSPELLARVREAVLLAWQGSRPESASDAGRVSGQPEPLASPTGTQRHRDGDL